MNVNREINHLKNRGYQFLRKTQKKTGLDNVYLFKGSFWLTIGRISNMLITLALAMAWARFVPKEVYGQYKYVLSITGLLAVFSVMGANKSVIRAVAIGCSGSVKELVKNRFKWSTLALLAGFLLAGYYWYQGNDMLAVSFIIGGVFAPLINNFSIFKGYLTGKKNFNLQTKFSISRTFLASAVIFSALLLTKNVIYLVLIYFSVNALLEAIFYFLTLKKDPPNEKVDPEAVTYGKHLSLMGILSMVAEQTDKILIFHYIGAAELAIYSFAIILPGQINSALKNIGVLAFPKLAAREEKEIKKTLKKRTLMIGGLWILVIAFYILAAGLIFKVFFPAYIDSVFYSRIYALSLLGGIALIPTITFQAKAKTKILYKYNLSMEATKIAILFFGVYYFGLLGLVWGMVAYHYLSAATAFFLFKRM